MALILNLETATTNCSVSVAKDGKTLALKEQNTPNYSHSEQLHLFIEQVMKEAKVSLEDLDAIAVSKGPGSYTGLRIGVSAAKGLCFALDLPLISIATLKSLASQKMGQNFDVIIALLDARRMEVYSQIFDGQLQELVATRAEIIDADSFGDFLNARKVLLLGSGADKCRQLQTNENWHYDIEAVPSANDMARLSNEKYQAGDFEDVAYFEPYYLKDFILQTKAKKKV